MGSISRDLCYFSNPNLSETWASSLDSSLDMWLDAERIISGKASQKSRNVYGKTARFKSRYHRDFLTKKVKPRLRFKAYNVENITNG